MQKIKLLLSISIILTCILSCKKESNLLVESPNTNKVHLPITDAEKATVAKIKELSEIMKLVYSSKEAVKEVNAAIYSGFYRDESVYLKDLLHPSKSKLYKSDAFKKFNVEEGVFVRKFIEAKNRLNHKSLNVIKSNDITTNFVPGSDDYIDVEYDGFTIYFPYSQEFLTSGILPDELLTIVAADRDADVGTGAQPIGYGTGGDIVYTDNNNVNDTYVLGWPTHILGINGVLEYDALPLDAVPPPIVTNPSTPVSIYRVFHGSSTLKKQYDRLISFTGNGGGSEIKICRISGYLEMTNQQVTNFKGDIISVDYSRRDIRKQIERRIYGIWHPDWIAADGEQTYAVYEEDTQGSNTFNGSLNTTVTTPPANGAPGSTIGGTVGFSVNVITQDELITQRKISRIAYFGAAFFDQGCGFSGDRTFNPPNSWPYYDCGANFTYTWPYNTY